MDNSQAPASILDTLRTVEFRLGLKGYNVDEVDEYLDKAAQEAEGLQEHVRQLNERLRQASERIAQLERDKRAAPVAAEADEGAAAASADAAALSDETLQRTLLLAQKFVDQTKRESEAEAAAVSRMPKRPLVPPSQRRRRRPHSCRRSRTRSCARRFRGPGDHPDGVGDGRREHGPASRVGAQPLAWRALRDSQVGRRERAARQLAHGCEAQAGLLRPPRRAGVRESLPALRAARPRRTKVRRR